jgi:circadian clock protein KaiC
VSDPILERVKTGIEAFDDLVMEGANDGCRRNATKWNDHLCNPVPGSRHYHRNESGVFVTFQEPPNEIEVNMASFGCYIRRWQSEKVFALVTASPRDQHQLIVGDFGLTGLLARILHGAKSASAKQGVLDSITQLFDHFVSDRTAVSR